MTLNRQVGNMYSWCDYTWNPIRGRCPHQCKYCYYQANPKYADKIGELQLNKKCLKDNLGNGNIIFVGSSTDMWAEQVPKEWIHKVICHCMEYPKNIYLFQSKNPKRFFEFGSVLPKTGILLGTTIETTYSTMTKVPNPEERATAMFFLDDYPKMVSIEPIMEFDLDVMIDWIKKIRPKFVSIGADSKGHKLPEPPAWKVKKLIKELKKFTEVRTKSNLKRLITPKEAI